MAQRGPTTSPLPVSSSPRTHVASLADRLTPPSQARLPRLSRPRNRTPRSPPEMLAGLPYRARPPRSRCPLFKPPRSPLGTLSTPPQPPPHPSHPCAAAPPRRDLRRRDSAAPPHQGPVQGAHRLRLDFWSFPGPAALRSDLCINLVTNLRHTPPRDPIAGTATSPLRPLQPLGEHPRAPRLRLHYSN